MNVQKNKECAEVQVDKISGGEVRFMNIAKALGIIAVVVGHSGSPLKPYVYLYHLSLFYFISGYFFRDEYVQAPFSMIRKRVKTLYLPYIYYQFAFLLLHNIFLRIGIYSYHYTHFYTWRDFFTNAIKVLAFSSREQLPSMLWFLCSLFFVNILFGFIRLGGNYLGKRESFTFIAVLLLFSFGIGAWYKNTYFELMVNTICVALIVYYAGHLFRRAEQRIPMHWALALAAIALLILTERYGQIDFSANEFGSVEFFLINTLLGIYANIYLAKRFTRIACKSLDYIGKNTIAIMALHPLSFKVIHLVQIYYNSYPLSYLANFPILDGTSGWWIAYSISGILIPLMATYCVEHVVGFGGRLGKTLLTCGRT